MVTAFSTPSCSAADTAAGTTAHDTTAAPLPGWHTTGSVTLTGDQGTAGMEYMIDCRNPTSAPIGAEIFAPEGPHTISHRAVDQANPTLATPWVHETLNVDSTAPVNTTSDYSSGWHKGIVNVAVTGTSGPSGIAHADWTLDGTTRSGSSGAIVPISGDADHAFTSSVTNGAGVATTPRTDTIRIDDGAPTDSTTYPVGWQYTPTTIDLYGADSRSGVDHVEWKLDGATPPNPGDNHTLIDMPEGTHTLDTQIVDNAGTPSGFARHTVSVDLTGPQDTTTVPAGWVTGPQTITVKGTDTGGAGITSVEWDLDNGERHGGGANNQTVQINDDRDHILQTRVTDGKPGGWTAWKTQHVKIDSVVPADVTSVSSGWQRTALAVDITGTDGMSGVEHVEWQLAGPVNSSGTSTSNPKTITISGDGTYTLNTRVFDNAGLHTGWSPHTIRIDP